MEARLSDSLIWDLIRKNHCHLVKNRTQSKHEFSTEPLNLKSLNSRKFSSYSSKALGIVPDEKGGVVAIRKKAKTAQNPAKSTTRSVFSARKSNRKTYKAIAGMAAKTGYRPDLRTSAVAKASAIRRSQRPLRPSPPEKLRGVRARKEVAKDD